VPGEHLSLDQAVGLTRTGDVWLFRGRTRADRTIRVATNSPVNHVGMSVVIEDLPALMWHAELGRSLPDLWSGAHQRGAQLHDLRRAVVVWATKYHQQVWLRQLDYPLTREMDDAVLRTIARLDGTPFPDLETAYCAEVVALTYEAMGLLPHGHRPNWYDAGRFWSGDHLSLPAEATLGKEIEVDVPA
jgi:hypothetical protein